MVVARIGATVINDRIACIVAVGGAINVVVALGQVVGAAGGGAGVAVKVLCPRISGDGFAEGGETDLVAPVTFVAAAAEGFHVSVIGGCWSKVVNCYGWDAATWHRNSIREVGIRAVFEHPLGFIAAFGPAKRSVAAGNVTHSEVCGLGAGRSCTRCVGEFSLG